MNKSILNINNQLFINENINVDIPTLLLKNINLKDVTVQELIEQIEAKKKCKTKLPTWFKTKKIYYPNKRNIEQTSSELTAAYKSNLINGEILLDLTTGLGVDLYHFSKSFRTVIGCELNPELFKIAKHNLDILEATNIKLYNKDGLEFIKETENRYDWVYIDPSRRNDIKGKVFRFKDSEPNVLEKLNQIFKVTDHLLIKSSPLVDIKLGIEELSCVKKIFIVSVKNEVKELLWILKKNSNVSPKIKCVNLNTNQEDLFEFTITEEETAIPQYSLPRQYLYEPNSSILKSGGFKIMSNKLDVYKLHQHSHLYTSDLLLDFPGRRFKINKTILFKKKFLKTALPTKANVTTRNFPMPVSEIRRRYKIKDGGSEYLFFTTNMENEKIVLVCEKA